MDTSVSIEEAPTKFPVLCEEVLAGEVIRLQLANGALLELTPVRAAPLAALSEQQLAECYDAAAWAAFENRCAKASD